jgi:hypothetical protein
MFIAARRSLKVDGNWSSGAKNAPAMSLFQGRRSDDGDPAEKRGSLSQAVRSTAIQNSRRRLEQSQTSRSNLALARRDDRAQSKPPVTRVDGQFGFSRTF